MVDTVLLVTAAEIIVLGCSGILSYLAFRAYRRTGSTSLQLLTVGFASIAIGTFVSGVLHRFGFVDFILCIGIERGLTALGFAVIIGALYVSETVETVPDE